MTEKRFINRNESIINTVTNELVNASSIESAEVLTDWLNNLTDENEQLKNTNQELYDELQETMSYKALKMGEVSILERENEQLKQQVNCHKSRIQLLSPLLDLADTIIDLSDDEKAKAFWEKRNNEVEQEWNKLLKGDLE